ncbi:MAG: cytochrome [Acidimicrobiales bacterium]|nr:cytochrome [Acidimicrobiales bacterium]
MPPVAAGVGLPWDVVVEDPVLALAGARASCGDTFVVDSGADRYLFTFSPTGVESFYALAEEQASKGAADWRMLRRKLPDEVFAGRRTLPHALFGRDDVAGYLANLERALDATVDELGAHGTVDVFAVTRRLGHRMGLASWGGPGAGEGAAFERLVSAFDVLDGAEAFVHPDAMAAVAATGKAAEGVALVEVVDVVGAALDALPGAQADHPLFARIAAAWDGVPEHERRAGVALDVALIHVASMSNLAAALGWALVDLLAHPGERARVAAGDRAVAEQCALESTRLAQRSIMARYVLDPVQLDVGPTTHAVAAGVTIATLLPLTNTTAAPGLDAWDPDRWNRRRLASTAGLPTPQLVTAFGHGRHTCPAQPFSLAAMTAAVIRLLDAFELTAAWDAHPRPVAAQIGGVARAADPCPLAYRRR